TPGTMSTASGSDPYTQSSSSISITSGDVYNFGVGSTSASPLPVTLVNFDADYTGSAVNLTWQTASEINNNYFDMERSLNGQGWESIGELPGHGNSQIEESYAYADNLWGVIPGAVLYYRLKQVDFNGNFQYSPIKSVITTEAAQALITVYPVPAKDLVNIDWNNALNGNSILTLTNATGIVMYKETVPGNGLIHKQLNLGAYPSGTYLVTVSTAQKILREWIEK